MNDKILTIKKSTLVDIANEVRAKTGSTDKIKVKDLDDAVAELSGGGVVEVDVLPEPTVPVPGTQMAVPNAGYVDKVYLNTNLSIEEVVAELSKISEIVDGAGPAYLLVAGDLINFNDTLQPSVGLVVGKSSDGIYTIIDYGATVNALQSGSTPTEDMYLFASSTLEAYDLTISFVGWNPKFNGDFNVNCEVVTEAAGMVSGTENDKITNLFYTCEMGPNPEFNAEAVYKLPDETYWLYGENGFEQISGKVDPMTLSSANNPEFGFYYGQVFSLDDPITINTSVLVEEMAKLELTEFSHSTSSISILIPIFGSNNSTLDFEDLYFTASINQDTEEVSVRFYNTNGYSILDKTYTVNATENINTSIRQLYKEVFSEQDESFPSSVVDTIINAFPMKFGVVMQGSNHFYVQEDGSVNGYPNLNDDRNSIYKCLKIGK